MRPIWVRVFETAAIALFLILALTLAIHLRPSVLLFVAAGLAYLVADLVSGLVHLFCDTCFREDSPVIGKLMIQPFRQHHRDPLHMTRHSFAELNGNGCLAMLPTIAAAAWNADRIPPFLLGFLFFFHLGLFATNVFHCWAHQTDVRAPIRWLHRRGLILTPGAHQAHHRNGQGAYCITSGWMNRPLDWVLRAR